MRRQATIAALPYTIRLEVPTRDSASYFAGQRPDSSWDVIREAADGYPRIKLARVKTEARARKMIAWWTEHDIEVYHALITGKVEDGKVDLSDLLVQCALQC